MSTLQSLEQEAYHAVLLVLATQPLDWVRTSQQCPSHALLQVSHQLQATRPVLSVCRRRRRCSPASGRSSTSLLMITDGRWTLPCQIPVCRP